MKMLKRWLAFFVVVVLLIGVAFNSRGPLIASQVDGTTEGTADPSAASSGEEQQQVPDGQDQQAQEPQNIDGTEGTTPEEGQQAEDQQVQNPPEDQAEPAPETEEPKAEEEKKEDTKEEDKEAEVHQDAMELTQQMTDENGVVICNVKANIPERTFEANTSDVTMEVGYVAADTTEQIKALMSMNIPEDKILGEFFMYDVKFKVNGEQVEPGKEITITFEQSNFLVKDVKKASTFYYNEANSPAGNGEAEIVKITQRADKIQELQNAGQSIDTVDDYDLSEISLREDGTADMVVMEGRRSTVYGCYLVEEKPVEVVENTTENKEDDASDKVRFEYKSEDVNVLVTLKNEEDIPKNAELVVEPVKVEKTIEKKVEEAAIEKRKAISSISAFDIRFEVNGKEVEPGDTVKVQVTLPEITKEDSASVYHYDNEKKKVEDMDATITNDGEIAFDTTHFSTYVIVQEGSNKVNIKVQHFNYSDQEEIYSEDNLTIPVGGKINDYAKATNWDVKRVVKLTTINGQEQETEISNVEEIKVSQDTTFRVYYTPKAADKMGETTFYDYLVKPVVRDKNGVESEAPELSINTSANYPAGSVKMNRFAIGTIKQNYLENRYNTFVDEKPINEFTKGEGDNAFKTGIVTGLSEDYKDVKFSVDEPGVFSDEPKIGKTILTGYSLEFEQNGDTYQLSRVVNPDKSTTAAYAGNSFFPLDKETYEVIDKGWDNNHNYYFGMRYDVEFTLGDYIGPLNYSFRGDDDLWVILDGKKVVIDLGGIHGALYKGIDLWKYLLDEGETKADLTEEEKNVTHRLTILYMERGANASNCEMEFTLPSAKIVDVTEAPTTSLILHKTNLLGEALSGAKFKLVNEADENEIYTRSSVTDGTVVFDGLREGTYVLTETQAPSGYKIGDSEWVVKVVRNGEYVTAKLYKSDGVTEVEGNQIFNYTVGETDPPYIKVQKTFEGLTDPITQVPDFQINLYYDEACTRVAAVLRLTGGSIVPTQSEDGLTYTWKIRNLPTGTYYLKEVNRDIDGYIVSTKVNGGETTGEVTKVTTQDAEYIFDTMERIDTGHSLTIDFNDYEFIAGSLTNQQFFVWTADTLSLAERKGIVDSIQREAGGTFNKITIENTSFFSTIEKIEEGIDFFGHISVSDGKVIFEYESLWNKVCVGTYSKKDTTNAEIEITNSYTENPIKIDLQKYGTSLSGNQLDGAKFSLYKGSYNPTGGIDGSGIVNWENTPITGYDKFEVTSTNLSELNLLSGYYKLVEETAPAGYQKLGVNIFFKIENRMVTLIDVTGTPIDEKQDMYEIEGQKGNQVIKVKNDTLYELPEAGGSGIFWYTAGGTLLMCLAGLLALYKNKRKRGANISI